ncbi:MAG: polysaccharide deacetylase family protein [Microgenomates group bacterium]|jgi:peptidoglycan/xylan/chitin deacetylase (PgdA/CDA1 family)
MIKLQKILKIKLPFKLWLLVLVILGFLTVLLLSNVFVTFKQEKNVISNNSKTLKQTESSSVSVKNTSTPTIKRTSQALVPVFSGNQIKVPVLYYHYVGNNPNSADLQRDVLSISPDKFAEQMKYLKDNEYTTISYDTLYAAFGNPAILPSKPIILTFDDGYIDFYYNAYNIIRVNGLSATVFIPTGLVGEPSYLTWAMIQEMYSSGSIHFGAHSVHHYHLASLSPEAALKELTESKKDLQDRLGININYMAYPYGETSSGLVSLVQKAGYVGAIGTWSNKIQSQGTIYNSPRLRISGLIDINSFASLLQ